MSDRPTITIETETDVYTYPRLREAVVYYRVKTRESWGDWCVTRVAA